MRQVAASSCPCGSGTDYAACCGPLHAGAARAATAEALMRSRYSAYVLRIESYLLASWHPRTRPATVLDQDRALTRWLGLDVRRHHLIDAQNAVVEFVARYRIGGGSAVRLHEISRFVNEGGRWYYLDGETR